MTVSLPKWIVRCNEKGNTRFLQFRAKTCCNIECLVNVKCFNNLLGITRPQKCAPNNSPFVRSGIRRAHKVKLWPFIETVGVTE